MYYRTYCFLTALLLLLIVPASARLKAGTQTSTLHRQFAAKDATIADLRRQIRALQGQVAELKARLEDLTPSRPTGLAGITQQMQDYNRLLTAARADVVAAKKYHALQQAVIGVEARPSGTGAAEYAAKERVARQTMRQSLLQALGLYQTLKSSPLYAGHFYETDQAMKVGDVPEADLLASNKLEKAVRLRFIQPQ